MIANEQNANCLRRILEDYCKASGPLVSDPKCSIYFSPNEHVDKRVEICTTLNIMVEALSDKYLGLPLLVGADRSDCFQYLGDIVFEHGHDWKDMTFSREGKK
jgi:hypothetical protein